MRGRARPRPASSRRPGGWESAAYLLFGGYLLLIAATFLDYGISWDEPVQAAYGDHILRWYSSGFRDPSALEFLNLRYYGGFFEVLAQGFARVAPLGMYEARHLVNALFGLAGVVGAWLLGRYLGGPAAGTLAALFLLLTPVYYGHAFNNPKDIPFATLYLFSCYFLVRAIHSFPRLPRGTIVRLGVVIGLTLGVRVGGVLLLGFLLAAFGLWYAERWAASRRGEAATPEPRRAVRSFAPGFLAVCALAYGVMLLWWPWAQVDPLRHPLEALRESTRFGWPGVVLFEGRQVPADELPWYYLGKWLLLTLPEFLLLGLAAGALLGVAWIARRGRGQTAHATGRGTPADRAGMAELLTLLLCAFFPPIYAAASGAVLYDAQRHFLFIVPLLAVLAALSLAQLLERPGRAAVAVGAATILSLFATAADMVELHPYQYIYFNRLVAGGLPGAAGLYETEYWGSSYREGAEWLARSAPTAAPGERLRVGSCSYPTSTEYYLRADRFEYVGSVDFHLSETPDLFLATTRFDCHRSFAGRVLHVVERQGTPILYVKEVSAGRVENGR